MITTQSNIIGLIQVLLYVLSCLFLVPLEMLKIGCLVAHVWGKMRLVVRKQRTALSIVDSSGVRLLQKRLQGVHDI